MNDEEFWAILHAPVEVQPIFYRLYYREDGTPICFSMEDLPHNYIEVDQAMYSRSPVNVRVVNGVLKETKPASIVKKLVPGPVGTACDPRDICVVTAQEPNIKWSLKTNETD